MQIQMAVLFFFSAVSKLRGDDWWSGDAVGTENLNPDILVMKAAKDWM